jgi:predicted permease
VKGLLVAGEMAMALVLLVGAGLLIRSLDQLQSVERGFEPDGLLSFSYSLPRGGRWSEDPAAFHARYVERLQGLPGVEAASLACVPPLAGHCTITGVREAGSRRWSEGSRPPIGIHYVGDDFFETLGVPVLQGRTFTSEDQGDSPPVVVLSQKAVEELFPDGSPLGRTVAMGIGLTPDDGAGAEVIGVVGDVLFDRPANGMMAEAFISYRQEVGYGTVILRARGEPLSVVPGARAALAEIDPDVPLFNVRTVADLESGASGDTRILGTLLVAFAALALLLACTGVWSVVAFSVARRTREIGVRVALGANPTSVARTVLGQGLAIGAVGVALGGGTAWAASRALESLLYGVAPADPWAFGGAAVVLLGVAALASWFPARRATEVDPMVALRAE